MNIVVFRQQSQIIRMQEMMYSKHLAFRLYVCDRKRARKRLIKGKTNGKPVDIFIQIDFDKVYVCSI